MKIVQFFEMRFQATSYFVELIHLLYIPVFQAHMLRL